MFKSLLSKIGIGSEPQGATEPPETLAQLRDAVAARLRAEPEVLDISPDPDNAAILTLRLASGASEPTTGTIDISNVYGRLYTLRNDTDRAAAIENLAQSVLATVRRPALDLRSVFANIRFRPPANLDEPADPLKEELAGDVGIVYQMDTPQSLIGLLPSDLAGHTIDELKTAGRANILREMAGLHEERVNDQIIAYRIDDNPPLTPAIVLTDEFWARVERHFPGGALLILRQRDEVAIIDQTAPSAFATAMELIDMARQREVDFMSDYVFERREGRLSVVKG